MSNGRCRPATAPAVGESFDEVVLFHLHAAHRLARWLTPNEQDAEDVVQEASLRVPVGTVMSGLSRARQAFRGALNNQLKQSGISERTHPREHEADTMLV